MRKPTSGGQGFSILPARTCVNCSQAPRILGRPSTSTSSVSPARRMSRRLPYIQVRMTPPVRFTYISLSQAGDAIATAVERHQRARFQPPHDDAIDIRPGRPRLSSQAATVEKSSADECTDRVQHMRAGIEQETAASDLRNLPPFAVGIPFPTLPDHAGHRAKFTQLAHCDQVGGVANLWRKPALGKPPPDAHPCGRAFPSG